jgi:hypothetical protein
MPKHRRRRSPPLRGRLNSSALCNTGLRKIKTKPSHDKSQANTKEKNGTVAQIIIESKPGKEGTKESAQTKKDIDAIHGGSGISSTICQHRSSRRQSIETTTKSPDKTRKSKTGKTLTES